MQPEYILRLYLVRLVTYFSTGFSRGNLDLDVIDVSDEAARGVRNVTECVRIWEVSQEMLMVSDFAGIWTNVNPAWKHVMGWSRNELLGRTSEWMEHPEDIEKTRREIERLAAGGKTLNFENRMRNKDGSYRHLAWHAVPSGDHLYCSARDVTEERLQAKALLDAQASLRQAHKMEAVGQLTGGIAHDFNNLIGGISGLVDLARSRINDRKPSEATSLLDAAESAIDKAAALTHRLLAFSRKQTLQPKLMNVSDHVEGFLDLIKRSIGPMVRVEFERECPGLTIYADANQFENALLNLCLNARDAMPRGGTITITSHRETSARASAEDQYVAISVADTGVGMSPEITEKAIEPFFTTKPIGAGTGLGLSMVYGFVEQSGGTLSITSKIGNGTCVQMLFPAGPLPARDDPEVTLAGCDVTSDPDRLILIIDDEPVMRLILNTVLRDAGYRTLEAADGPSGLALLASHPEIVMLVSDIGLPNGMSGLDVALAGRALRPGLPILHVTGYAPDDVAQRGTLVEGAIILPKPFKNAALRSAVEGLL